MKSLLFLGFFLVMNDVHSQEISHFNLTQNYNKAITYEVEGLSESDLIVANAMFFNGRLNDGQKNLINNPFNYPKGNVGHPLNQYAQKISDRREYQNCRTLDLVYQKPVIIGEKTINVSLSEMGAWGGGYSSKDKISYELKINIENEKISLSIDEGQYARTVQLTSDTKTERRKTFDQMFNKKGQIKKLLNNDAKIIAKAINNSISVYFNFIECFKNKKAEINSEYSIRFNKQLKEDSLAQLKEDSLAKIRAIQDSINSLFTGVVVGESFYDGDHTIEIITTSLAKETTYNSIGDETIFYLQSGEIDEYSILKKNGLNNNGENITGTYVQGRWAEGKVLVEEYQNDGSVLTSTRSVPRIIEIEPIVDENTDKLTKFSGNWIGKFTETKYRKNKIYGEWNVLVSNNGIVLGKATSYYVVTRGGREYDRTDTDRISGVLSTNGEISMKTASGANFTGRIIGSSVSGKWVNGTNLGGSFSGKKEEL